MTPEQIERLRQIIAEVQVQKTALETLRTEIEDLLTKDDLQFGIDTLLAFAEAMDQTAESAAEG